MIRLPKPPAPDNFEKGVEKHREQIANRPAGTKPDFDNRDSWRKFKVDLSAAQNGKCGYCEVMVFVDRWNGDVEHYRPKSSVDYHWFEDSQRKQGTVWETGYWWLAHTWENYILACSPCNSGYKQCLFPVKGERDPNNPPTPGSEDDERPLLLSPFEGPDPIKHLEFRPTGQIRTRRKSAYGKNTIEVCGLNREGLRRTRQTTADLADRLIGRLKVALQNGEPVRTTHLPDILLLGRIRAPHAGMVRSMFHHEIGQKWSWVVKEVADVLAHEIAEAAAPDRRTLTDVYELAFEDVRGVRAIFERVTAHSWRWLEAQIAADKCDQISSAIEEQEPLRSVYHVLLDTHVLGESSVAIRQMFSDRTGQPWGWLEAQLKHLQK